MPEVIMDKSKLISTRKFGEKHGVGQTLVRRWMDEGIIKESSIYINPKNGYRKIIETAADEDIKEYRAPDRRGNADSDSNSLVGVKLQQGKVKLAKETITLRRLRGQLVEKKIVYNELFEFGKQVREQIMIIPDRVIDDVMAAKSRTEAHTLLTEALEDALRSLADTKTLNFENE